jgi:hypothetical protein
VDEGEVLTESGWKKIEEVLTGDLVQSVLPDGTLKLKEVTGTHKHWVEEDLVRIKKKNIYISMTPDHRVVYQKFGKEESDLIRFNEHKGKSISVVRTPRSFSNVGYTPSVVDFSSKDYAEFLGWYVAEGCTPPTHKGNYKVLITQNKVKNHEWVRRVMESSGKSVCYSKNGDFQITNKELWEHLRPLGKAHEKHFPREFLESASKEELTLAFNAYAAGDGHWQSENSCTLTTVSPQLADDIQEIAVKLGFKTQVSLRKLDNPNHRDQYTIYIVTNAFTTKIDKSEGGRNDVVLQGFKGFVYCLSVKDTENFVLRQKGFVWISGNTSNPGGVGHQWVKKMFIDPAPANKSFWATDIETGKVLKYPSTHSTYPDKPLFKRRFIPARLSDNPYLMEDGTYEATLLSLPENERKRLLEGSWDVNEGAAFPEFDRNIHVIEPFDIPNSWRKFRAADYGYGSYSAVVWFAMSPKGQLIAYRELYVHKVLAIDLADMVLELERGDGNMQYGVLDSSLWHRRGDPGPSLAEQMIRRGCRWRPSDRSKGSRVAGKNELHRRLQIDDFTGEPRILFFNTCVNIISQIPNLPLDKRNPEDVDTNSEDHLYDAIRYGIQSRPRSGLWDSGPPKTSSYSNRPADKVFGY